MKIVITGNWYGAAVSRLDQGPHRLVRLYARVMGRRKTRKNWNGYWQTYWEKHLFVNFNDSVVPHKYDEWWPWKVIPYPNEPYNSMNDYWIVLADRRGRKRWNPWQRQRLMKDMAAVEKVRSAYYSQHIP